MMAAFRRGMRGEQGGAAGGEGKEDGAGAGERKGAEESKGLSERDAGWGGARARRRGPGARSESKGWDGVGDDDRDDVALDGEVDDAALLRWSQALDFDRYISDWHAVGTSAPTEGPVLEAGAEEDELASLAATGTFGRSAVVQ